MLLLLANTFSIKLNMGSLGFYGEKKHFSPRSLFRVPKEGESGIDLIWVALLKREQALL